MANIHDITRDEWMLRGPLAKRGYDWWWHSMTAENAETGEKKAFYVEFFTCNPALAEDQPVIVWNDPVKQKKGVRPSYLMVNAGFWGEDHGQLHRFFSLKDVEIHADAPYSVKAADCFCSENHSEGSIEVSSEEVKAHPEWMSDAGSMSWNFDIKKEIAFHVGYGASRFFRTINAFEMFWHAEGPRSFSWPLIASSWENSIMRGKIMSLISPSSGPFQEPFLPAGRPWKRSSGMLCR